MLKKICTISMLFCLSFLFLQCEKNESVQNTTSNSASDVASKKAEVQQEIVEQKVEPIKYSEFVFPKGKKDSAMAAFDEKYSEEEQYTILALNRLDKKNKWRADTLIIPEKLDTDFLIYSPFPKKVENLSAVKKMVFFSYAIHAFAVYENGILKKWGPSSMGKQGTPTEKGLTFTNWKSEMATSTVNSSWKLGFNFNIYNRLGIGWHQYDLPGYHASHSCLRLLNEDAKWLYGFADQWVLDNTGNKVLAKGTPVLVFGDAEFKTKPWRNLLKNPEANTLSEEKMSEIVQPILTKILEEQKNSEEVRSRREAEKNNDA